MFMAKTYYFAFLGLCCYLPVCILTVYFFHHFLARMVKKRRYLEVAMISIAVYILGTGINYFAADLYLSNVQYSIPVANNFQHRIWTSNWNTGFALILGVIVIGIEIAKSWYLTSHENLELLRINSSAETRIRKSRINPSWLFLALDKIKNNLDCQSATSTAMILNLSDLLSYSLYESDTDLVELEKEFSELQHLLTMEQLDVSALVRIDVKKSGEFSNKSIAPMSVINKIVEQINAAPDGGETICQMNLHFHAGKNLLELDSRTICDSGQTTNTTTWVLSGGHLRERLIPG
jgi:sensor histidine kinase YesM